jgi:hypothetical protein
VRDFAFIIHNCILHMLTIAAFLVGLWFLGLMLSFTLGGMIHLLLVAGLVLALTKIIQEASPAEFAQQ